MTHAVRPDLSSSCQRREPAEVPSAHIKAGGDASGRVLDKLRERSCHAPADAGRDTPPASPSCTSEKPAPADQRCAAPADSAANPELSPEVQSALGQLVDALKSGDSQAIAAAIDGLLSASSEEVTTSAPVAPDSCSGSPSADAPELPADAAASAPDAAPIDAAAPPEPPPVEDSSDAQALDPLLQEGVDALVAALQSGDAEAAVQALESLMSLLDTGSSAQAAPTEDLAAYEDLAVY